jgi:dTDP-4-amino-4,6-dideoxygalactose transaminase
MDTTIVSEERHTMSEIPFVKLDKEYDALQNELNAEIQSVLESGWLVLGQEVDRFENEFAEYVGVDHGVGVNSGTDALYLALRALGIGAGDEVITVSHSFVSTADAIVRNDAKPVFVDIDPETYTMDVSKVEERITGDTEAIVPVHLYGHAVDMDPLVELAEEYDLSIVEDAAQAHGTTYKREPVGSFGDIACFSFYPVKNLGAAGDGGMIVTDDNKIAESLQTLRDMGSVKKYHHDRVGLNSRLDEIQAAILRTKLPHLDEWNTHRRMLANKYSEYLPDEVITPVSRKWSEHVFHLYVIRLEKRDRLQSHMENEGIDTLIHYPIPIHEQNAYESFSDFELPVTEKVANEILSLPISPCHTQEEIQTVSSAIVDFYK